MLLCEAINSKSNHAVLLSINYYCPKTKEEYRADNERAQFFNVNTVDESKGPSISVECGGCGKQHELLLTEW